MAKVALNIDGLDPRQKLLKMKNAHAALTTNAAQFPTPNPTLAVGLGDHDAAKDVLDEIDALEQQLVTKRQEREQKMGTAMNSYALWGSFVENKSGGDPALITLGGFDVAQPPGPTQPLGKVQNNALTSGDDDGEADAAWDRLPGAKFYEYQTAANPAGPWTNEVNITKSRHAMSGKTSGQKLWGRVRGVNSVGPGAWSDPACCTVP